MGNTQDVPYAPSASSSAAADISSNLVTAAFSAAFGRPVYTSAEYESRKHEPQFAQVETLDVSKVAELSFEPAIGKFGDVYGKSGDKITVWLKTLSGRKIELKVGSRSYVEEIKYLLEEQEGIPVDNDRLVLLYRNKRMQDGSRISDYGVTGWSTIDFSTTLKASAPNIPLILSDSLLDPGYDYDFSGKTDDGTEYYRGGRRYYRPCGWKRIALKVHGKYEDDTWLGTGGMRTESSSGEWPVSYHGTKQENADGIARQGYLLSKGKRFVFGKGIYSTPSIEVAELYASGFKFQGKQYRVVFQNRVSPTDMETVSAQETDVGQYWVQPNENLIRPYGLCIKEL